MSKGLINEILNNIADLTNLQTGEVEIDIGEIVTSGVLTSSGQYLAWTIPLGRVLPKGTTITKVLGNIVVRAANHNAAGVYIWKQNSTERVPFNTLENSVFIDGAGATQTILPSFWRLTIQGESNLLLEVTGNTSYFFPGNATNNGYLNNQPCVVDLQGVKITIDIPTQSIYVPNATITLDAPNTTVVNNGSPIPGTIQMYAGSIAPEGFLICDGSAINRIDYSVLFSIIGQTYGAGDGVTTFNIPDLRSRVGVGASENYSLGSQGGESEHTHQIGMKYPAYYRSANLENQGGLLDLRENDETLGSSVSTGSFTSTVNNAVATSVKSVSAVVYLKKGYTTIENSMQPYLTINYIIATGKND